MEWLLGKRDIEMLQALCEKEPALVAQKFKISTDALNSWVARVRLRKARYQWWLNNVLAIEKRCPHVKRRLLPARRKRKEEEEW